MTGSRLADPGLAAAVRAVSERRLSAAEVALALAVPITPEEKADVSALVAWFCRRYPTPAERLAYVRRAYRRWTQRRTATHQPGR